MTFKELAIETLKILNKPARIKEIWECAVENKLHEQLNFNSKFPEMEITKQITEEMVSKGVDSVFVQTEKGVFFLKTESTATVKQKETPSYVNFDERDMGRLFSKYIKEKNACQVKRIGEKENDLEKDMQWNQPDLVAVKFPEFNPLTSRLNKQMNKAECRIYSYELKEELNHSNFKEYYFQAVANSSWANEGYLVVSKLDIENLEEELIRLNEMYGVGVIHFDLSNQDMSSIIVPARVQKDLDWFTIDRMGIINTNFREFMEGLSDYIVTGVPNQSYFD